MTTLVWLPVGGDVTVEADDPGLAACVERAFPRKPLAEAFAGMTGVFVLRLGPWTSYTAAARPGPYTKERVQVAVLGGTLRAEREATVLGEVDLRLSVLSQELARCTDGAAHALVRARVRADVLSAVDVAASSRNVAACASRVFTDCPAMKATWTQPAPGQTSTSKANILAFLKASGADGLDLDYEPVTTPFDADFIAQITNDVTAAGFLLSAAPYTDQSNWLAVAAQAAVQGGGNHFVRWNLQL